MDNFKRSVRVGKSAWKELWIDSTNSLVFQRSHSVIHLPLSHAVPVRVRTLPAPVFDFTDSVRFGSVLQSDPSNWQYLAGIQKERRNPPPRRHYRLHRIAQQPAATNQSK